MIILGWGPTSAECPYDDEVWGVNNVWCGFEGKRIDKIFAFDPWEEYNIREMKKVAPIVSWRDYADIKYPLEEIIEEFNSEYFTNSVTYMIAYALYLKEPEIRFYGIDAPYGSKYALDKSGVEYWLGRAIERGMKIVSPEGSNLLKTVTGEVYGGEREGRIILNFSERMHLAGMLPAKGHYEEMSHGNVVRGLILPKKHEIGEYQIKQFQGEGGTRFMCEQDFPKDIFMPKEAWEYVVKVLEEMEAKGELPVGGVSLYDKLVLATKREGG
jgi:hypothetical protein